MASLSLTGVEVRNAGRSDLPAARRVLLAAYQEYAEVLPPAVFGRYLTDILDVEARARTGRVLVAEHGRKVVGTVTFHPDAAAEGFGLPAGWAGLRALGVEPSARGHGVGRALMEACRELAQAAGATVLSLHTAEFMTAAVALYERMGFRRDPAFDVDGPALLGLEDAKPVPVITYRLDLTRPQREQPVRVGALYDNPVTGARVEVPPGVAHEFWNPTAEEVRLLVEVRPGERLEQLIRQLYLAAQDGRTDARGRPRPLHAAVLAREFDDTIRFPSPPRLLQRALSGLLAPVARATGRRALVPGPTGHH